MCVVTLVLESLVCPHVTVMVVAISPSLPPYFSIRQEEPKIKTLSYSECMNLLARPSSIGYVVSTHSVTMHLLYPGISLWHQQTSCSKVGVAVRVTAVVRVNTSQLPAFIQMKMASQDLEASKSEWMVQVMYGYMRLARSLLQEFFSGVGRCLAVGGLRNGESVSRVPTNFFI